MQTYGVVYDVGVHFEPGKPSVETWDEGLVRHDMRVIAEELNANAVRIEGQSIDRLQFASRAAHEAGLKVYYNPWLMEGSADETDTYLAEAAVVAEKLRGEGLDLTFVAGCELTIMSAAVFPGKTHMDRIQWMVEQYGSDEPLKHLTPAMTELNRFLARLVSTVRLSFAGPISYSAGQWEQVDWSPFDIVGIDHYRMAETDDEYVANLEHHRLPDKPLVVMEVGCCSYTGASKLGGGGFMVLEGIKGDGVPRWKDGAAPERNEIEQADYIRKQLHLLETSADGAFLYVYSRPAYPVRDGELDLDLVNYALVKTFPPEDARSRQMPPWEPKEAFRAAKESFALIQQTA